MSRIKDSMPLVLFRRSEPSDERFLMRLEQKDVIVTSAEQEERSLQAFNKGHGAFSNPGRGRRRKAANIEDGDPQTLF